MNKQKQEAARAWAELLNRNLEQVPMTKSQSLTDLDATNVPSKSE